MGRSHLVSSPKATISRMKSILALVLLGVAIIHLSGATEEETDKQVAQQENQLDLSQVQELAEPDAKRRVRKNKSGKASTDDKKLLKGCKDAYGKCRKGGESIRPVLSACQAGGRTEEQTKKDVGNVLKNEAANKAITEKVASLVKSASGRKSMNRREVTFNGATYKLTTCGDVRCRNRLGYSTRRRCSH